MFLALESLSPEKPYW